MLPFSIQIEDGVPISDQVFRAVRKAVLTGQLRSGDTFPSVRSLSQELRMSPTTAHKVVAQLKDAGFLASRPGIGMVVTANQIPTREDRMKQIEPLCRELVNEAVMMDLEFEDLVEALRVAMSGVVDTVNPKKEPNHEE
jgi:GntR family transcriptional regulator